MRSLFSLLCLPLILVIAGCGTSPERRLDAPTVQPTGLAAAGDTYVLTLRLANANTVPLVVNRATHTLYLGEQSLGRIDDREPVGLPPLGEVSHAVKLTATSAAEARAWLAKHPGDIRISVQSSFKVAIGYDDDVLTLSSTGTGSVKAP